MLDHHDESYDRKNLTPEFPLSYSKQMSNLLIDESKEIKLFDTNPEASFDVRTLPSDLNSSLPTPQNKHSP